VVRRRVARLRDEFRNAALPSAAVVLRRICGRSTRNPPWTLRIHGPRSARREIPILATQAGNRYGALPSRNRSLRPRSWRNRDAHTKPRGVMPERKRFNLFCLMVEPVAYLKSELVPNLQPELNFPGIISLARQVTKSAKPRGCALLCKR